MKIEVTREEADMLLLGLTTLKTGKRNVLIVKLHAAIDAEWNSAAARVPALPILRDLKGLNH